MMHKPSCQRPIDYLWLQQTSNKLLPVHLKIGRTKRVCVKLLDEIITLLASSSHSPSTSGTHLLHVNHSVKLAFQTSFSIVILPWSDFVAPFLFWSRLELYPLCDILWANVELVFFFIFFNNYLHLHHWFSTITMPVFRSIDHQKLSTSFSES